MLTSVTFKVTVMPLVVVDGTGAAVEGNKGLILLVTVVMGSRSPSSSCGGMIGRGCDDAS